MTERTVSVSRRREVSRISRDFNFSADHIAALQPGWQGASYIREYRRRAWEAFNRLPMPTTQDEAWRRTDLRALQAGDFELVGDESPMQRALPPAPDELLKPLAGEAYAGQIVLSPQGTQVELDPELSRKGLIFCDLATAERQHHGLLQTVLGQVVREDEGKFAALAASFARQGVFIYVPRGLQVEQPLHSILWGPGINLAYFSHILVRLEEGASLTYVHEAASHTEAQGQALHAGLVEISLGPASNFHFVELQSWGEHVWNFSHERAKIGRDANLDWVFGAIGSHLTKNFSDLELVERGASGRMSGFYFTDGVQHLDHDTQQNHLAPNTTSDLLFKGALKEHSRSVWQGMIYVAPGAQKTDGYQANRNLVLSPNARADSIPGLEILADDVRCTHGATVGKIDADQVFYLRSRGISARDAERLIVEGFFDPIMQRIPFEGVRSRFQNSIEEKMG
ncbi:MAG: Fe-S cluster assembly protein SufD [Chloroflexi bacterium RBG_16_54_18]|nr:MAG: Fe-S cluster assembly protein SufD [Chloroflexi bacterium RBG_16_54_18]